MFCCQVVSKKVYFFTQIFQILCKIVLTCHIIFSIKKTPHICLDIVREQGEEGVNRCCIFGLVGFWRVCRADFSLDSPEDSIMWLKPTGIRVRVWFSRLNHQIITKQSDFPWNSMFVQTFIHCVSCSVCGPWLQNFNELHAELFSEPALQRGMSHWEIPCVPLLYCFVHKFRSVLISLHTFSWSYRIELINCPSLKKFSFTVIHSHPPSLFSFHAYTDKIALEICQPTQFKDSTGLWAFLSLFKTEVLKHRKDLATKFNLRSARSQWQCLSE